MIRDVKKQIKHQEGTAVKQATNAILAVSSRDRYPGIISSQEVITSPYNFTLYKNQNYLNGFFSQIALSEIRFPWHIAPFTDNNGVMFVDIYLTTPPLGPTVFQGTVDIVGYHPPYDGWTTCEELATLFTDQVLAVYPTSGALCTFHNNTCTFEFTTTGFYKFVLRPTTIQDPAFPNRTTIYQMMNWPSYIPGVLNYQPETDALSGPATMLRTNFIDITCNQLTYNQAVKDADTGECSRDLICRLYLIPTYPTPAGFPLTFADVGAYPFLVYKDFSTPKQIKWSSNIPVASLQFQIYDDQGCPLATGDEGLGGFYGDGHQPDWDMTLLVTEL